MTLATVAQQLYQSLKAMPCRCQKHWQDGKAEMVTRSCCSRCAAVAAYESLLADIEAIDA